MFNWVTSHDDVKAPAESHKLEEGLEDAKCDPERDLDGAQNLDGNEDGNETKHDVLCEDTSDIGVLIIVDVEETVTEYTWGFFEFSFKGVSSVANEVHCSVVKSSHWVQFGQSSFSVWFDVSTDIDGGVGDLRKSILENISCLSGYDQSTNEIFLVSKRLMLESESGGFDLAIIIEDNIKGVLLTADTI